ncbi:DUF3054 domain-containing protein [Ilumatobacter sp.]|uniref:DUF3054 domain-containing protein n=1 Tax=Ilumatobacter sp. TaxID=1967498 RepID=UPI003751D708
MHPRTQIAAALDAAVVVTFVAIGRRNHEEGEALAGVAQTAAPFMIALAVAWIAWRVWAQPTGVVTGVKVWLTTVALGMVLRNLVFNNGTATSFMIVATVFLGTFLIGWRAVETALIRRSISS